MALDFAAGCLGGMAGLAIAFPFDTVKVHLQTQNYRNPVYKGTLDCIRKIIQRDSLKGLYRGMSSPMAGVTIVNAIVFGVYGNTERHLSDPTSLYSHFIAGSMAGLAQSVICSPMELIKTRLQVQQNMSIQKYQTPTECLRHIWKKDGFKGILRGLGITIVRDIPGFSSYFVSYEMMMNLAPNPSPFHILMAGGLAGTCSWLVSFPIDVVKSRLQADGINSLPKYNGIVDCVRKSYKEEGLAFLCRGLTPTLLRAFPMNAVCFLVVTYSLKLMNNFKFDFHLHIPIEKVLSIAPSIIKYEIEPPAWHIKEATRKFLKFSGIFNEAVCFSEVDELVDLLHNCNDNEQYYYKLKEHFISCEDQMEKINKNAFIPLI